RCQRIFCSPFAPIERGDSDEWPRLSADQCRRVEVTTRCRRRAIEVLPYDTAAALRRSSLWPPLRRRSLGASSMPGQKLDRKGYSTPLTHSLRIAFPASSFCE